MALPGVLVEGCEGGWGRDGGGRHRVVLGVLGRVPLGDSGRGWGGGDVCIQIRREAGGAGGDEGGR